MSRALKTYNSNEVSCVIAAIPIEQGKADPFVTVEYDEDDFEEVVALDGQVTLCAKNNPLVTITLKLQGSSPHNTELSALRSASINKGNGSGVGVFYLKDNNGDLMLQAAHCWLKKAPPIELGVTPGERSWIFRATMNKGQIFGGQIG